MQRTKWCWLCRLLGHKFKKIKDLRKTSLSRKRIVYRCSRCRAPMILRAK